MIKKVMISVLAMTISASVMAQEVDQNSVVGRATYNTNNSAYLLRIKYQGSDVANISHTAAGVISIGDGTITNTVTISNKLSIALSDIMAATNSAGKKNFLCEYVCGLPADTVSNAVIAATTAKDISNGQWTEFLKENSTSLKQLSTCSYGDSVGERWVNTVYGWPDGTGNVAVAVYVDQVEKYRKLVASPITNLATTASGVDNVNLMENLSSGTVYGIHVGPKSKVLIRATRVTNVNPVANVGALITSK
jgi:hypothetical protein